ncbi:Uu.00g045880.m01.CDS01 [Anthostomella pinea]|uniref:Uu.00g045880.m01.CDS01 n=1 Tax=Anthostomella pinea TaxID=933095 RepID=A0AAI8YEF6_9PEZI|nr:Uu.00g045880.m01.CDS01 [Anthostomella pinea]
METISKCFGAPDESKATAIIATTVVTTITLISVARFVLWPRKTPIIPGALTTSVPRLSEAELQDVAYRTDHFPGARDVVTPYGNIRVYEFGPEDGRKVLMLHGISTSCMTLADLAVGLEEKGCRVMLFDLFGRGYSDAPGDLPYDTRLFTTQILLALASSPLPWTGDAGFSLVGYSLGGGIAANFAATFPRMVASLLLLAPAGLIRPENIGRASRLVFTSGIVPERLLAWLTKRRLRTPIDNAVSKRRKASMSSSAGNTNGNSSSGQTTSSENQENYLDVAVQEAVDPPLEPSPTPTELRVASFVHWSLDYNEGFVPAMMSTMRYAPLMDQQHYWRLLSQREPGTTAVLLGRNDNLIQREDYEEDALPLLGGKDNVFWRIVPGSHNFPFTNGPEALEVIYEFWGMN